MHPLSTAQATTTVHVVSNRYADLSADLQEYNFDLHFYTYDNYSEHHWLQSYPKWIIIETLPDYYDTYAFPRVISRNYERNYDVSLICSLKSYFEHKYKFRTKIRWHKTWKSFMEETFLNHAYDDDR